MKNSMRGSAPPTLRPYEVAVLLWLILMENQAEAEGKESESPRWTLAQVAAGTHLSVSEIHFVLRRVATSRLCRPAERQVNRNTLVEFLIHGIKHAFPPVRGTMVRGTPTAYAMSSLDKYFGIISELAPVYTYYKLLAFVDNSRGGDPKARERSAEEKPLRSKISPTEGNVSIISAEKQKIILSTSGKRSQLKTPLGHSLPAFQVSIPHWFD